MKKNGTRKATSVTFMYGVSCCGPVSPSTSFHLRCKGCASETGRHWYVLHVVRNNARKCWRRGILFTVTFPHVLSLPSIIYQKLWPFSGASAGESFSARQASTCSHFLISSSMLLSIVLLCFLSSSACR